MAKKGGSHQSKTPAEKKATTERNKKKNVALNELIKEGNAEIDAEVKANISLNASELKELLVNKFNISKCKAESRIKKIRIKEGLYKKGSVDRSNKPSDEKKFGHERKFRKSSFTLEDITNLK